MDSNQSWAVGGTIWSISGFIDELTGFIDQFEGLWTAPKPNSGHSGADFDLP